MGVIYKTSSERIHMQLKDTTETFGLSSILLHWATALLIIALFTMGQVMEGMPRGFEKSELMDLHKSLGMLLLILVFIRLTWRLFQGFPQAANPSATFLNMISRLWHWALLIMIIAIPVTGFISSDAGFSDVPFFGLFTFPDILGFDHELHEQFEDIHGVLTKIIIPLVLIHVLAAFKHHFWDKDTTLKRIVGMN